MGNKRKLDFVQKNLQVFFHELRSPLNGIIGFSDLISNEDMSPSQSKELARDILNSGETLLKRINLMEELFVSIFEDQAEEKIRLPVCELLDEVELILKPTIRRNALEPRKFCDVKGDYISTPESIKSLLYELGVSSIDKSEGDIFFIGGLSYDEKSALIIGRGDESINPQRVLTEGRIIEPVFSIGNIEVKILGGIFSVTGDLDYE